MMQTTQLPPIMDAAAWAETLRCSQKTVEERMRSGDLPGEKFGDSWICPSAAMLARVNEIAVEKMLDRRQAKTPAAAAVPRAERKPPALPSLQ